MAYVAVLLPRLPPKYALLPYTTLFRSTPPTCSTTATTSSHVNSYPITCSGAADNDYTDAYTPEPQTLTPVVLPLHLDDQTMAYGAASLPTLTFKYVGLVNADTATMTLP